MTAFIWKGDDEGGDEFASLYGVTFSAGAPVDVGHLLPWQVNKLRNHPYFTEVPEDAPTPRGSREQDERAIIKQQLEDLGALYDKRWGIERLRAALQGATREPMEVIEGEVVNG
jgi:hypothetical protein